MVAATILRNPKSRYLDNGLTDLHSIRHDGAHWLSERGVLFTKVRTPVSVRKFCVRKFLRYVRNAIQKTFLRTRYRKFVRKYTHDRSYRTTKNFRKDSKLMKLPRCFVLESQHKFVYRDACKMYIEKLRHHLRGTTRLNILSITGVSVARFSTSHVNQRKCKHETVRFVPQ